MVELMVGLLISLIGTLAMMTAFAAFEGQKRTTASGNDAQQNGSYALFELERQIRSAGSGMDQGNRYGVWGCTISAYSGGALQLPVAAALPAPFGAAPTTAPWPLKTFAVPVLISSGGTGPDTIGVIGGNAGTHTFKASIGSGSNLVVPLDNTIGMNSNSYVLNSNTGVAGACSVGFATNVTTTLTGIGNNITLSATSSPATGFTSGYVFDLGQVPSFNLYGVLQPTTGAAGSLMLYDLLQRGTPPVAPTPVADGIVTIKALYGIDGTASCPTQTSLSDTGTPPNVITAWVAPTGLYAISALTATNVAACTAMARIKAIRLAVVAQSELPERPSDYTGSGAPITLFPDLAPALQQSVPTQTMYRYKVYDTTIPIRNAFINKLY